MACFVGLIAAKSLIGDGRFPFELTVLAADSASDLAKLCHDRQNGASITRCYGMLR